jgi:hypothetical protein
MRKKDTTKRTRKNTNLAASSRTQKNTHTSKRINHRSVLSSSNPLVSYLGESPDDVDSRLWQLAHQLSRQPFDANAFRDILLAKLRRVPYSQRSDPNRHKKTFHDVVKMHHALATLFHKTTLCEIWGWLLLRDIIKTDREFEFQRLSVEKYPLRFHSFLATELSRHERAVRKAIKDNNVDEHRMDRYLSVVNREYIGHRHICLLSRFPGSRRMLLQKGVKEDITAQERIYQLLKARLRRSPLPDRFLRRLTQLVCAEPDIKAISDHRDDALRKNLERRP